MTRLILTLCLACIPLAGGPPAGGMHANSAGPDPVPGASQPPDLPALLGTREFALVSLAPGGKHVAYVTERGDLKADAWRQELVVASGDGRSIRPVPLPAEASPAWIQWLPDGRHFACLLQMGSRAQVRLFDAKTLQARTLVEEGEGIGPCALRPDGGALAWISGGRLMLRELGRDSAPSTLGGPGLSMPRWHPDGRRIFALRAVAPTLAVPPGIRWLDAPETLQRLVAIDTVSREERVWDTGEEISVLAFEPTWGHVVFQGLQMGPGLEPRNPERQSLRVLDLADGRIRVLAAGYGGPGYAFWRLAPDGRTLAYTAPPGYLRHARLRILDLDSGRIRTCRELGDLNPRAMDWDEKGENMYVTIPDRLDRPWYAYRLKDEAWSRLTPGPGTWAGRYMPDAKAFQFTHGRAARPPELYLATATTLADPARWIRVSRANESLAAAALPGTRIVTWPSRDGRMIEGLLHLPAGRSGSPRPMIVQVNGGRDDFRPDWQAYIPVLTGLGYLVFQPNPRGLNDAYGEAFLWEGHYPHDVREVPAQDVLTGVEHLCATGVADRNRLGLMGWSIGGSASAWVLATTDVFKAVCSGAGSVEMVGMYGSGQYRSYYRAAWGASAFKAWDYYAEHSPLKYMHQAHTPTLFQVGERDEGVVTQCLASYHALRESGVPTELLVHRSQPHQLQTPRSQLAKMLAELHWFSRWIQDGPPWATWTAEYERLLGAGPQESPARTQGK